MLQTNVPFMPRIRQIHVISILTCALCLVLCGELSAQHLIITKENGKTFERYKPGKSIDFRVDYNVLYPGKNDSILEARVYGIIDTITGREVHLIESQLVLEFKD